MQTQKSQAGPRDAQLSKFTIALGNLVCSSDCYPDAYMASFEITLKNGQKRERTLMSNVSENPNEWTPRNRFRHFVWRDPRNATLALYFGPLVKTDPSKVCIVARADGEGPWQLRLSDAEKQRHSVPRSIPKNQPAAQRPSNNALNAPAPAPQPIQSGNRPRGASDVNRLSRRSETGMEQAARRTVAIKKRPTAVSHQSGSSARGQK